VLVPLPLPSRSARASLGVVVAGAAAVETRRRWLEGVVAVGATERERESARERERARESDRERRKREGARSRGGCAGRRRSTVAGGCGGSGCSGERERESEIADALVRGGRRVREFQTLNKPYGFGC